MQASDILIAACTIVGPVLAVQAQKAVERATAARDRRSKIFEVLMSTYATRIAPEHVQALNTIEIAFNSSRYSHVVEAWRVYLIHLNKDASNMDDAQARSHNTESDRLFKDLMHKMSSALRYGVTRDMLARGTYHPMGQFTREQAQLKLLDGASKIFAGETNLGMEVKSFPVSSEAVDLQLRAYAAFLKMVEQGRIDISVKSAD